MHLNIVLYFLEKITFSVYIYLRSIMRIITLPLSSFNFDFCKKKKKTIRRERSVTTFFQRRRFLTIDVALFVKRIRVIRFPTPPQTGTVPHALQIKGNWIIVTLYYEWLWLLMQFDLWQHVNITKHVSFQPGIMYLSRYAYNEVARQNCNIPYVKINWIWNDTISRMHANFCY